MVFRDVFVCCFGLTTVTFTQTDYNYCKVVADYDFFLMSTRTTT